MCVQFLHRLDTIYEIGALKFTMITHSIPMKGFESFIVPPLYLHFWNLPNKTKPFSFLAYTFLYQHNRKNLIAIQCFDFNATHSHPYTMVPLRERNKAAAFYVFLCFVLSPSCGKGNACVSIEGLLA